MTKSVQIQRYRQKGRVLVEDATSALMLYADHLDDKAAALLQVREMLEAKAKEWQQPGMYFGVGKDYQAAVEGAYKGCADYLLSLAATLGNQGK